MPLEIVSPIHVEAVGLGNVRFFAPKDGAREFPWPSLDDLYAAMTLDRSLRRAFRSDLGASMWASATRKVVTPDGVTTIGQHYVAQGLLDAMTEVGRCPADLFGRYAVGATRAMGKLLPDVHGDALMSYVRDAMRAGGGWAE